MHFHFPGMVGLLSSGEFFNSAESVPAAFTCFFLQASNSQLYTEENPSTHSSSQLHTTPKLSPGDWDVPWLYQTGCCENSQGRSYSIYRELLRYGEVMNFLPLVRQRARSTGCKLQIKLAWRWGLCYLPSRHCFQFTAPYPFKTKGSRGVNRSFAGF